MGSYDGLWAMAGMAGMVMESENTMGLDTRHGNGGSAIGLWLAEIGDRTPTGDHRTVGGDRSGG